MKRTIDTWFRTPALVALAALAALALTTAAATARQAETHPDDPRTWTAAEILSSDLSFDEKLSALNHQLVLNPQNPELYNNLGVLYAENEQWEPARDAFIRAVQADPRNAHNHRNLGNVFVQLGQTDMAMMEYEAYRNFAVDGAPDAPLLIGDAWAAADEPEKAEKVYRDALTARGEAFDEHVAQMAVRLARRYDEREDHEALAGLLDSCLEPAAADVAARGGADADPVAAVSQTLVERRLVLWLEEARELTAADDHSGAAALYECVREHDPDRPDLLPRLAEAWLAAGDPMKAKVLAQRAVAENADDPFGWKAKGRIADRQGQTRDALAAYEKVLELDPDQLDVAARIGQLYMTIGDNVSARRYMGQVATDPNTPVELLYNYAISLQREDEFALSVGPLKKVVERAPENTAAWLALGAAHRRGKDYADAEAAYRAALALTPDPRTAFQAGFCASKAGRTAEAVQAYRAATDLDPTYAKAWYNLALAEIRLKDYRAALADLEVLGLLEGDQYRIFFNKGICHSNLGESEEAIIAYEMALDLKETSAAWNNLGLVYQNMGDKKKAATCVKRGDELKAEGR